MWQMADCATNTTNDVSPALVDSLDRIICGDCLEVMASMPESSVDSIVTDPPYGLSFMGKDWDHGVPGEAFWREALRVAKPGAHLLAFGGTRTHHRLMCAIEDAGWEIRDCLGWLYGSGFPKSLDVSKAIDKQAGAEREVVSQQHKKAFGYEDRPWKHEEDANINSITAPATPEAVRWQGWGTALKPAWEPIVLARKPLRGTVAQNVLEHGTGALNIDGCRVGTKEVLGRTNNGRERYNPSSYTVAPPERTTFDRSDVAGGRFPANLIHDGSDEVEAVFPMTKSGRLGIGHGSGNSFGVGNSDKKPHPIAAEYGGDSGSASRFFYCAKASSSERGEGNNHPTVKPQSLMQYLCRLVTPPGGVVLDPFTGSGSTLLAALKEGFRFIGIELEEKYCEIARRRVAEATQNLFATL